MTRKKKILICAILLFIVTSFVLAWRASRTRTDVIRIGAIFPLSGPNASYGEAASRATSIAVEKINDSGGVNGLPLEIDYEDSAFQSVPALNAYEKLKFTGVKVFLTIGSQVGFTVGSRAREDGNLNYELTAVTPRYRDDNPLTCRSALTADVSSALLSDYFKQHDLLRLATFVTNDEQGLAVEQTLTQDISSFGGKVVAAERYQLTDNDFRTQIAKIEYKDPDALVLIAPGQQAAIILQQLKDLRFDKPTFSNNWTIINQDLSNIALADGVIFSDFKYQSSLGESSLKADDFKREYKALYSDNPPVVAANAYDAVDILAAAIQGEGYNPMLISRYIISLRNYAGVSGSLSFDSDCEAGQEAVLREVVGDTFRELR